MMPNRKPPFQVPSRAERLFRGTGHLMLFAGGLWGFLGPLPVSMAAATNPLLLAVWFLFMSTSLVAAVSVFTGKWVWEYAVLPLTGGGTLIYAVAMLGAVVAGVSPGSGLAMFATAALTCYIAARWVSLRALVGNPSAVRWWRGKGQGG